MASFCKFASRLYETITFFENECPVRTNPLLFGVSFSMRGRSGCEPYPSKVSRPPCKFEGSFLRGLGGLYIHYVTFMRRHRKRWWSPSPLSYGIATFVTLNRKTHMFWYGFLEPNKWPFRCGRLKFAKIFRCIFRHFENQRCKNRWRYSKNGPLERSRVSPVPSRTTFDRKTHMFCNTFCQNLYTYTNTYTYTYTYTYKYTYSELQSFSWSLWRWW